MRRIAAIDYSLRSTAIAWREDGRTCVNVIQRHNASGGDYESDRQCLGVSVQSIKKQSKDLDQLNIQILPFFVEGALSWIRPEKIYFENYGFAASGQITRIAESLGEYTQLVLDREDPI